MIVRFLSFKWFWYKRFVFLNKLPSTTVNIQSCSLFLTRPHIFISDRIIVVANAENKKPNFAIILPTVQLVHLFLCKKLKYIYYIRILLDSKCNWVKSATNITNGINRIIAENFTLETWNIFLLSFANIEDTWTESDGWPMPDISWWYINAFCTLLGSSHCDTHLGGWTALDGVLLPLFNICLMMVFKTIMAL